MYKHFNLKLNIWRVVRVGRRSTIGNRVTAINRSRVRIPCSPPKNDSTIQGAVIFFVKFVGRDSNKEGAYEVCGRKQSSGLFSPTWQRAKRGDRRGSVGLKSLALRQI